jgi:hypothetical protein
MKDTEWGLILLHGTSIFRIVLHVKCKVWSPMVNTEFNDNVHINIHNNNNPWRYSSDEPGPAEQPPLAVFPDCTRRYWVDM